MGPGSGDFIAFFFFSLATLLFWFKERFVSWMWRKEQMLPSLIYVNFFFFSEEQEFGVSEFRAERGREGEKGHEKI